MPSRGEPSVAFRLVAACCRWPTDRAAIQAAAVAPIDWPAVVRLARRHRVIGFVRLGLVAAGIELPPRLDQLYHQALQRNLLHYGEAVRLVRRLAEAGIPAALLKGVVLAERAYGSQAVKQTIDNDLLVAPAHVPATIAVLEAMGYRLVYPPLLDMAGFGRTMDLMKECQFADPTTTAVVDLHWRMHPLKHVLPEPSIADEAETVSVDGKPLPAMLGETMMVYLAVHGARHFWSRLKWLADFNALLGKMDDAAVAAMRARAAAAGVGPCMDATLILCARWLGARVPDDVHGARRARGLARIAQGVMLGPDQHEAPGRYVRAWLASAPMIKAHPRFLAHVAWDFWVSPDDALALPLPKPLHPLYLAISPVRRAGRLIARGFARTRSGPMRAAQEK